MKERIRGKYTLDVGLKKWVLAMWGILGAVCFEMRPIPTSDGVIVTYISHQMLDRREFMRNENMRLEGIGWMELSCEM